MNCQAPCDCCCGQDALIPHSQDPPPIFGPLPKSTEGRKSASLPYFLTTSSVAQLPVYQRATFPCKNPWSEDGLGFAWPFLNSPWNRWPHVAAAGPLRVPSAEVRLLRSIKSPPKLWSIGEYAYGNHSPPYCGFKSKGN